MKTISVEITNILNDVYNKIIVFNIAAIVKQNNIILNIYTIKHNIFDGDNYINSISSLAQNEELYLASLCVLTEEEQNKIAFLQSLL